MSAILMERNYWENSMLSVARFTGGLRMEGNVYIVVNKYGKSLVETAIDAHEPADLIDERYLPYYKKLGRDKFIELVEGGTTNISEFKEICKKKQ